MKPKVRKEFKREVLVKINNPELKDKCFITEIDENGGVFTSAEGRLFTLPEAVYIRNKASGLMTNFVEMELVNINEN